MAAAVGAALVLSIAGCASSHSGAASGGTTGTATGTTTGTAGERGPTGTTGSVDDGRVATGGRRGGAGKDRTDDATGQTGQPGRSSTGEQAGQSADQHAQSETGTATAAPLSDAQILGVVKVANDGEVAAGNLAVRKATAPEVRDFAKDMVKDHTEASQKVDQASAGTPMSNSEMSSKMVKDANTEIQALNAQSGPEFDRSYIQGQVKMHQGLLDAIQGNLLPHAQSAQVRQLLEQIRDKVTEHLRQAQQLQQQLASVAAR